ncbi:hypothetical protein H4R18_000427 [Coemansia javaensis]|uniref:RGS domain-containing protein n=1 Tax=Coemansia javaensis TaxID=2761396 RepID=A0A9W8HGT9_9FUNG|nr:hypothetical protein H4R18_000427 [Coemansia javaensis]
MALGEDGRWIPGSLPYRIRAGVLFSVYGVYVVYVVLTLALFIAKARDRHSGLAQRGTRLVVLQAAGCFLMGAVGMVSTALQQWPCFLKLWFCNVGFLMAYSALAARAFQHIVVSNIHSATNRVAVHNNPVFAGQAPSTPALASVPRPDSIFTEQVLPIAAHHYGRGDDAGNSRLDAAMYDDGFGAVQLGAPAACDDEKTSIAGLHGAARLTSTQLVAADSADTYRRLDKYTRMQHFATDRVLALFVLGNAAAGVALSLAINVVNKQFALSPVSKTCKMMWGFVPVIAILAAYVVLVMPLLLVKCWRFRDAFGIRNDLIVSIVVGAVGIIVTAVWETALFHLALRWSGWFFTWLCAVSIHTSSVAVPLWGAIRHSRDVVYRMHGASSLGSHKVSRRTEFNAILASPHEYRHFCDFAATCFCSELTAFIDEYQALKALTVRALGAEPMWGDEDTAHFDPGLNVASAIDLRLGRRAGRAHVGYLSVAAPSQAPPTQSPPTESILDAARAAHPQLDISEAIVFPIAATDKLVAILRVFINSGSHSALNLPSAMALRIRERLGRSQLTLTVLDEPKEEILNMLFFDVFTRYSRAG